MADKWKPDWDPRSDEVLRDQRAAYDGMREHCPVAHSDFLQWSVFRHEDVTRVLHDPETFSNAVSHHLSVPNGMDPPEHTAYRRIIEPYFAPERINAFEPTCRQILGGLAWSVIAKGEVEFIAEFALPTAARAQCAFLGWPAALHEPLVNWTQKNYRANLAGDREAMAEIAVEFQHLVDGLLEKTRPRERPRAETDVTGALMQERIWGRPLSNEEIANILRNWTVGEIGTISAAIGIIAHYLAHDTNLQSRLRADSASLPAAIDEILRIHGPLPSNRRITKSAVKIGERHIPAGERLSLMWIAANRDPRAFEDPGAFRWDRDPEKNLLYGAGIHVCPGAPLARMELRIAMEELLKRSGAIATVDAKPSTSAVYPASGFSSLPLRIR